MRKDLGWSLMVTPFSQVIGTQAALNVLYGRYKVTLNEVEQLVLGYYGKTPAPVDPEAATSSVGAPVDYPSPSDQASPWNRCWIASAGKTVPSPQTKRCSSNTSSCQSTLPRFAQPVRC